MNRLYILLFFISLWFSAGLTAQTQVEASVQNLTTNGTNVQFDIFLRTTNANDLLFLGNADFVLTFNTTSFTTPALQKLGTAQNGNMFVPTDPGAGGTNTLVTGITYFNNMSAAPINDNELVINLNGPTPGDQAAFNSGVARIDNTANTHQLGSFQLSGYNGGAINLAWKLAGTGLTTQIFNLANSAPFAATATTVSGLVPATCPTGLAASTAPTIQVTNSTCAQGQTTPSGGSFAAPTGCPTGSTVQYSTDNGANWSATVPTYNQTTAVTVLTRCNCDVDNTISSQTATVTSVPATCAPVCPTGLAGSTAPTTQVTNSICAQGQTTPSGGSFAAPTGCPTGSTVQYSTDNGANWSATVPTYNQTTAVTVLTRCNCNVDNTISSQTATVTSVPATCAPVCPTGLAGSTAPTTQVTNSICAQGQTTPSGGSFAAPTGCPTGSTVQYSTDNGANWSATVPTYNQTTAVTVLTRCNCDVDNTISSQTATVTSVPATCAPVCPTGLAGSTAPTTQVTNSICAQGQTTPSGGSFAAPTGCPTGSTVQYSTDNGANWSATVPTYNQTTAVTVLTRCNCDVDNTISSQTATVTSVPATCAPVCPTGLAGSTAPTIQVTNSTCAQGQTTPSGGSFAAPTGCPTGSTIQYSTDNGATFSNTVPTYNQTTAVTVLTQCNCNVDNTIFSQTATVTSIPATCATPTCEITSIMVSNISTCNNNNTPNDPNDDTYTQSVTVNFNNPPTTGLLVVSSGVGNGIFIDSQPVANIVGNSYTFTNFTLPANGQSLTFGANFSVGDNCTFTANDLGTAPNACSTTQTCPSLGAIVAPPIQITNSTCSAGQTTPTGGSFAAPVIGQVNATIQYSVDNGATYSTTLPTYNQTTPVTVISRYACDFDNNIVSQTSSVTTVPGTCSNTGGGTANCDGATFTGGNGQITVGNLTAAREKIEIIGSETNWQVVGICEDNCNDPHIIPNLAAGVYTVKLQMFGNDGSYCYRQVDVTVTSGGGGNVCDGQGGDSDGDGTCDNADCQPNNPAFPATPGTACNDGNPNTTNDRITADGCSCAGTPNTGGGGTANCDGATFTGGNGQITVGNLTTAREKIEIIGAGTNWQVVLNCEDNCNDPQVINNLTAGVYTVKLQMFGNDGSYCYREMDVTVTGGGGGNICDGQGGDSDGDGTCDNADCQPNNPAFPATPDASCNDGNPNTTNDRITADGCSCAGTPTTGGGGTANCDGATFTGGNGQIKVGNLTAAREKIEIIGANTNYQVILICEDNCNDPHIIPNLAAGVYTVKLQMFGNDGSYCYKEMDVTVTDGGGGNPPTGGGIANCEGATFTGGNGQITLGNLTAVREKIEIIGANTNYQVILVCEDNCNDPHVINNLSAGSYQVKLQMFGNDGSYCYREEMVQVGASLSPTSSSRIAGNLRLAGYKKETNIALEWAYPSDLKKSYYVVEKSLDGENFEPMTLKKAEGAADLVVNTDFDNHPNDGNNYYRIFTQFENGETSYSETINVPFAHLKHLSLFPNPVHQDGQLSLNLKDYAGLPAELMIHNSLGQSMLHINMESVPSELISLKLEDYESGLYALSIKVAGRKTVSKTFIVSRL